MIEVTLSSVQLWKNKEMGQSWELWLKEL